MKPSPASAGASGHPIELMSEFFERRQGPDESAGRYIEDKARLARRMRINNEAFVLQGIIQGLRADVRRDVMLLQPASLEDLTSDDRGDAERSQRQSRGRTRPVGQRVHPGTDR